MKKIVILFIFLTFYEWNVNAQSCNTGGCSIIGHNYPTGTLTPTTSWSTQSGMNAGNWTLFSVTCGNTYDWTYCDDYGGSEGWDAQLTLYNYSSNSTGALLCFQDNSGLSDCPYAPYLRWTASFTGTVQLLTTVANCQSNSGSPYSTLAYRIFTIGSGSPITPVITAQGSTSFCQGGSTTLQVSNSCSGCTYNWYPSGSGTSINVTNAGTYYCIASNSCGTSPQSNSITVSVSPEPTVPIISVNGGNTSFCQGGSATLQVTNVCTGCSYTWYPSGSGTSITVNSAGTYYCTSSNSCGVPSSQSNSISITVNPSPTTPVISTQGGITSFCQGTGSVTLQVTNICTGCSYTWYPSGSGTSFNVTNAGTYYLHLLIRVVVQVHNLIQLQ